MGRALVQRRGARAFEVVAALAVAAIVAVGCMETRRSLGEDCLKNDDCLSGICSSLSCAASPPVIGTEPVADAATAVDTGAAAPPDAGTADETDAPSEATNGPDAVAAPPDAADGAESSAPDEGGSGD